MRKPFAMVGSITGETGGQSKRRIDVAQHLNIQFIPIGNHLST